MYIFELYLELLRYRYFTEPHGSADKVAPKSSRTLARPPSLSRGFLHEKLTTRYVNSGLQSLNTEAIVSRNNCIKSKD